MPPHLERSAFAPRSTLSVRAISEVGRRHAVIERMAARSRKVRLSGRYSRFVGLMKWLLPLSAVALALLVVVWPYFNEQQRGLPLSFAAIETSVNNKLFMTNARFLGSDDRNQPYTITADSVVQAAGDSDMVQFIRPKADIQLDDGSWLALTAARGALRRSDETLTLDGGVDVFSDAGYEFRTAQIEVDLRSKVARGDQPVEGQGPLGVLSATGFTLDRNGRTIRFSGRVKLVLYPKGEV